MKCNNCGKPVRYDAHDTVYFHIYDWRNPRWKGDNGYWCSPDHTTQADGRKKIDFNMSKCGFNAIYWKDGRRIRDNYKTGEYFELEEWDLADTPHNEEMCIKYWIF